MIDFSPLDWAILILLLFVYSYVSYRVVNSLRKSYSAGLFRIFANVPLVNVFLSFGAMPFLMVEKIVAIRAKSPARRRALDDAPFVGNNESWVFHRQGCEYRDVMGFKKRVPFSSVEEAKGKGYRPCATCKPR